METIFGTEMPIAAKVVLALVIVISLASGVFYVVRYVSASRLGGVGIRGRQPRLAVIEIAGVDPRRRLLLIRRDNVEHLIMIGGPSDVVIEPNIVRAVSVAGARDSAPARQNGAESTPRTGQGAESAMWPAAQTEPVPRPQRPAKSEETTTWAAQQPDPPTRTSNAADHLAGLAAELGRAPAQPDTSSTSTIRREPKRATSATATSQPAAASGPDQNLTEMAQRLEAALRHTPGTGSRASDVASKPAAELSIVANRSNGASTGANGVNNTHSANELRAPTDMRPPRTEKQAQAKAVYDNLEQEMASLLGRPAGKT
jgi:flagellar protein FliO/FliZ